MCKDFLNQKKCILIFNNQSIENTIVNTNSKAFFKLFINHYWYSIRQII